MTDKQVFEYLEANHSNLEPNESTRDGVYYEVHNPATFEQTEKLLLVGATVWIETEAGGVWGPVPTTPENLAAAVKELA